MLREAIHFYSSQKGDTSSDDLSDEDESEEGESYPEPGSDKSSTLLHLFDDGDSLSTQC